MCEVPASPCIIVTTNSFLSSTNLIQKLRLDVHKLSYQSFNLNLTLLFMLKIFRLTWT